MINKLLEFEEKNDVLKYRFKYKNLMIWPYIRTVIFYDIVKQEKGIINNRIPVQKKNIFKNYFKYNTFKLPKSDILFVSDSVGIVDNHDRYMDRIVGEYIETIPKITSNIISISSNFEFMDIGRKYVTDQYILKLIEYSAKDKTISKEEDERINEFINFLKQNFPIHLETGTCKYLYDKLAEIVLELPATYLYYSRLIKKVSPKVVFWNCASYSKPAIKVLNDLGVITAEFQHGYIGTNHLVYNYSNKLKLNKEYASYMPKYYLTYGEFWTRNMCMIPEIVDIGNPIVATKIKDYKEGNYKVEKDSILLIVADYTNEYVKFIDEVLENSSGKFKIYVKLHPISLGDRAYFEKFENISTVEIIEIANIYEYIYKCEYIVGDTSTSLYEAAALKKKVFIIDSDIAREHINKGMGTWIGGGKEFIDIVNNKKEDTSSKNEYFITEWKENYINFIEKKCGINIDESQIY